MPTCASASPDRGPILRAARALLAAELGAPHAVLDWAATAATAERDRLGAWLYALGREQAAPAGVLRRFRPAWLAFRGQHLVGAGELGVLLDACDAAGIPLIPLKGPALAETLYRDPAGRPFTDLDLLVPVAQVDEAIAVLHGLGYRHPGGRTLAYERRHAGAASFVPAPPAAHTLPVDLHWSLVAFPGGVVPRGLADAGVWARAVTVERLGRPMLQLADDDLLLYLALHLAVHHPLTGLRWRLELAVFLGRRGDGIRWEAVTARAGAWGVAGALYFALAAVEPLGVRMPAAVRALRPRGVRGRILDRLAGRTADAPHLEHLVNLVSLDAAADRRRMLARALAPSRAWVRSRYGCDSALQGWRAHYGGAVAAIARRCRDRQRGAPAAPPRGD